MRTLGEYGKIGLENEIKLSKLRVKGLTNKIAKIKLSDSELAKHTLPFLENELKEEKQLLSLLEKYLGE